MANIKKADLIEELTAKGIEHDPDATIPQLQALLHSDSPNVDATVTPDPAPKVDSDRKARWQAFLARAEEQRIADGTHAIFLAQKDNGEFDVIPDSFV